MITHYQPVRLSRTARGKCPVCSKPVTRTKRFEQTASPFHPAVKTLPEGATVLDAARAVRLSVASEAEQWVPDFRHAKCEAVDHD